MSAAYPKTQPPSYPDIPKSVPEASAPISLETSYVQANTAHIPNAGILNQTSSAEKGFEQFENIDCVGIERIGQSQDYNFQLKLFKDGHQKNHHKISSYNKPANFLIRAAKYATLGFANTDVNLEFKGGDILGSFFCCAVKPSKNLQQIENFDTKNVKFSNITYKNKNLHIEKCENYLP